MRSFLLRLFGGEQTCTPLEAPLTSIEALQAGIGELATKADVAALADAVQKTARAQARISLKLEDLESKLEGGFQDLRRTDPSRPAEAKEAPRFNPVLDAVDLLEEAARTAREGGDGALADGISGIGARLSEFLETAGLSRVGVVGVAPDARLFRVVGTEAGGEYAAGVITRVVRAAVVSGSKIVREGEVLIASRGET